MQLSTPHVSNDVLVINYLLIDLLNEFLFTDIEQTTEPKLQKLIIGEFI